MKTENKSLTRYFFGGIWYDAMAHMQCFHNRNLALRTWRSKALQWGKCGLLSKMRPKCGPILELLQTWVVIFIKIPNSLKNAYLQHCTFRDKSACVYCGSSTIVHALIVLLSRASPKHSPHTASCFPGQLLVFYLQLCNQALTWGECGLSSEMRPKCGPFHHFGPHADQVRNCGPLRKHCTGWWLPPPPKKN